MPSGFPETIIQVSKYKEFREILFLIEYKEVFTNDSVKPFNIETTIQNEIEFLCEDLLLECNYGICFNSKKNAIKILVKYANYLAKECNLPISFNKNSETITNIVENTSWFRYYYTNNKYVAVDDVIHKKSKIRVYINKQGC